MAVNLAKQAPLAPNPVIMACMGHAGVGIGAEAYRWVLMDVGADPKAPSLKGEKEQLEVLRKYGTTIMRFGTSLRRGEVPIVPRALLVDLDPRSANLILQAYPELFAMRDRHALYGLGGAARNWAEGRGRFKTEIEEKHDLPARLNSISPEPVRGFILPFSMGGGTGGSFSSAFIEYTKNSSAMNPATVATFGIIPEFGWDPVIYEPACISIVLTLAYQMKYSDAPILMDNKTLRFNGEKHSGKLKRRASIVDELPKQIQVGWREYRNMNLISAHAIAGFMNSFIRETEWDMSNYRTWLAAQKPKFVIPWLIPLVPQGGSELKSALDALNDGNEGILFDLGEEHDATKGAPKDSACVIVKSKGILSAEDRSMLRKIVQDRFKIADRKIIIIKAPAVQGEPAALTVLLNVKAIGERLLPYVADAEDAWDQYKGEYEKKGLSRADFKQAVLDVTGHLA